MTELCKGLNFSRFIPYKIRAAVDRGYAGKAAALLVELIGMIFEPFVKTQISYFHFVCHRTCASAARAVARVGLDALVS